MYTNKSSQTVMWVNTIPSILMSAGTHRHTDQWHSKLLHKSGHYITGESTLSALFTSQLTQRISSARSLQERSYSSPWGTHSYSWGSHLLIKLGFSHSSQSPSISTAAIIPFSKCHNYNDCIIHPFIHHCLLTHLESIHMKCCLSIHPSSHIIGYNPTHNYSLINPPIHRLLTHSSIHPSIIY